MSSPACGIRNACCILQLLLMMKINGIKAKILPAGIAICFASRHLESQTNHVYVRGLHDQSEHTQRG